MQRTLGAIVCGAIVTTAAVMASAGGGGGGAAAAPALAKPVVAWSGPQSGHTHELWVRVRQPEDWRKLWETHEGEHARRLMAHGGGVICPEIDFERYEVVAYFRGLSANSDGEVVTEIREEADRLVIRFDSFSFQSATFGGPEAGPQQPNVTPYGIWVIERTDKPVVIEENTQRLKDQPAEWTRRAVMGTDPC